MTHLERRQRHWQNLQAHAVRCVTEPKVRSATVVNETLQHPVNDEIRDGCGKGFTCPLTHTETFTEPLELASGLANANIEMDERGRPRWRDGKVRKIIENLREQSPGTFGSVRGRLVKASTQSSIKSQRWHNAHEEQRCAAAQARRNRLLVGWLVAGTPSEREHLEKFHLPIQPRTPTPHRAQPLSSPPPPANTLPQPSAEIPTRPAWASAACLPSALPPPPFQPHVVATIKPRVLATTTPPTSSAWGASTIKPRNFRTWSQSL